MSIDWELREVLQKKLEYAEIQSSLHIKHCPRTTVPLEETIAKKVLVRSYHQPYNFSIEVNDNPAKSAPLPTNPSHNMPFASVSKAE